MKKYTMIALVAIACLTAFSFAPTGGRDYVPVEQTPEMETGYIDRVQLKNDRYHLSVDQINWYEGSEATEKFLEREGSEELDGPPNDYYIINDDETLHDLVIAEDAEVLMQLYNRTGNVLEADIVWNESITVEKFVELINTEDDLDMKSFPYHLTVKDGEISRIVQQYVP
ncbi:hypothetical protein BK133_02530 [Paenibacillus sp. FSL H8-0548]|uniref:hypothetical protein n=1 Tax=Paenibacillus sp. FSL H8-0548 TaxID=1920422 RepID=UPI00096F362C|nr:hypothetical protein [Paenibacillus sp. FSL H8-0548]OMF38417.1 hypothetical protein BK133_02530 [Paenibacillus sp. FSL H8-0548]